MAGRQTPQLERMNARSHMAPLVSTQAFVAVPQHVVHQQTMPPPVLPTIMPLLLPNPPTFHPPAILPHDHQYTNNIYMRRIIYRHL